MLGRLVTDLRVTTNEYIYLTTISLDGCYGSTRSELAHLHRLGSKRVCALPTWIRRSL